MKTREECTCTCHTTDPDIIHFVPCCDTCCDATKEELLAWIKNYQKYRMPVTKHLKNNS